ncbi:squamosa promoter-binding-like protein 9 [Bidens hawaiensis]|uniref:squamosa promoter-binding-like protein 9 n=1 Tax=Bidens hawaiensis TaxID=980011 RepID=UPI004049A4B7
MDMGGSSSSSLLKIGLKFGEEICFEDDGGPVKKGKTVGGDVVVVGPQPPRCQVEGCNLDLTDAKTYYSRHKVCGVHSKTAKVIVNGLEQRFCQQCSRFHKLPEFDQGKRSCRKRLAGHNERRRKPTSGTLLSARYGSLPSSIFGNRSTSGGFLMDFSSCSRERVHWPNHRAPPTGTTKLSPLPWQSNLDNPPPYINPNVPPGPFNGVQDSNCALSLLSNHSSASRDPTLTLEYYPDHRVGTDTVTNTGAHMVQPSSGTVVKGQGHFLTGWGYDTDEAHLGLGQISQSGGYSGELGPGQQGGRQYDLSVDHIDWSL